MVRNTLLLMLIALLPIWPQASRAAGDSPTIPAGPATSLPNHRIVPNDLLAIMIVDEPQFSRPSVRVDPDGTIAMPVLSDRLKVENLLPRELEAQVARQLKDQEILVHPMVTVSILEYATRQISVVGDVKSPQQISITQPITLLEALAKAGWTTAEAGAELQYSKSASDTPRLISIEQLQKNADSAINVTLTGGEIITVLDAPKIWVMGNVAHPQAVPITKTNDATVLKVIAKVEGLTQYYNKQAYIYRADATGKRQEIGIPLKDIMHRKADDVQLMVDDILLIPDDNGTRRRALLGALQSLGGSATSTAIIYSLPR